ncbi:MAG: tripartite tricarboxylate transporter TctB family protein [Noviherbaspirillum sp.]
MEQNVELEEHERTGVPTYVVEAVIAGLVLIFGLVVIFGSRKLGSGWTSDGPGAGYFPFYIGLITAISGAGILFQALFGKNRNNDVFVDSVQFKRVMSVLLPALVYVVAIQLLGLYIASAIYITLFMVILGKYTWLRSMIVGLAVVVLFFCLFEIWFKVPLYKGQFDLLGPLGY